MQKFVFAVIVVAAGYYFLQGNNSLPSISGGSGGLGGYTAAPGKVTGAAKGSASGILN